MIKYNYEVSVNENRAKLNKDIFLFRGNRNIHYYFSIKGARFAFEKEGDLIENANAIYAAVTVIKPNGVEVANAIAPVENGLIHLKVTEDLIDEEVEIGDFDLVFDLFDDSDGAVTIPKIKGQFHVQERPCTTSIGTLSGNVNVVNQAVVDLAIATQENEQLIVVDDDGKYVKTTWVKGDKISIERLNKIEEGIEKNSTQYKDIANELGDTTLNTTAQDIKGAINELFQDVSNGKTLVANAITDKGINTLATDTFQTMATNINKISETNKQPIYKTINGNLYRQILNEDFNNNLDKNIWTNRYLVTWTDKEYLSEANYKIENSCLSLIIDKDSNPWNPNNDGDLRISGIQTGELDGLHKLTPIFRNIDKFLGFIAQYGYFEIKAKMFPGSGTHCAWWMVGLQDKNNQRYEIDIFENLGKDSTIIHTVGHSWSDNAPAISAKDYDTGINLSDDFHIYGFEWTDTEMVFYFDGVEYHRGNVSLSYPLITILSCYESRKGNWTGAFDNSIPYPKEFKIDYFKAYKRATKEETSISIHNIDEIKIDKNTTKTLDNALGVLKELPSYCYVNWNDGVRTEHWVKWKGITPQYKLNLDSRIDFEWEGKIVDLEKNIKAVLEFNENPSCTNITLNNTTLSFTTTDTQTLTAIVTPADTTDRVVWSVNPTGIVTVTNGVVTPIKNGNCTITATCGTQSATCDVTVTGIEEPPTPTPIELLLKLDSASLTNSSTVWEDLSENGVNFTLSNGIPSVSDNGLLMTSVKCIGTKPITLNGAFTEYYCVLVNANRTGAFCSYNINNTTEYCVSTEGGKLKINGYSGDTTTTASLYNPDKLQKIAIVRPSEGNTQVYLNGVLQGTYDRGTFEAYGNYNLVLGASSYNNFPNDNSNFVLKELQIFNGALSAEEAIKLTDDGSHVGETTITKTISKGKGFDKTTGEIQTTTSDTYGACEEYIPLIKGNTYSINACGNWICICGYNSDKTFNKVISGGNVSDTSYQFINDCDYIRIGCGCTTENTSITITGIF